MSDQDKDQDFFFEDEDVPTKADKSVTKAGGSKPAPKPAAKPAAKPGPKPVAAQEPAFFDRQISVAMTGLIAVVALLVGIIGTMLFVGTPAAPVSTVPGAVGGTGVAPQLSPQQLNSGQLPAGHPAIPGAGAASGTAGSKTTTPGK